MRETITTALHAAVKAREALRVSTLRLISAAIKDRDIAARTTDSGKASDAELLEFGRRAFNSLPVFGGPFGAQRSKQNIFHRTPS